MKLVIIGGTAAGTSAAAKARRNDPTLDIVLYEKSDTVSFGACGLPYFIGGYFADTQRMVARTVAQFQASGIAAHTHHEVLAVDSAQKTLRVKDHTRGLTFSTTYDRLVIASGSTPLLPPFQHRELENIFTLKTLQDGQQLKRLADDPAIRQVIIVGAGFIGLELADTLHGKDKAITVIQAGTGVGKSAALCGPALASSTPSPLTSMAFCMPSSRNRLVSTAGPATGSAPISSTALRPR